MAKTNAAVIGGTFLKPGKSKNGRLYTKENIGKAVSRMQEALKEDDGEVLSMYTSHGMAAKDDLLSKVGKITKVFQKEDGSACWEADIANTASGRDVVTLNSNGFANTVSIRGGWMSDPKVVEYEGDTCETADDLAIIGIDFTGRPGVKGAKVNFMNVFESAPARATANHFSESVDEIELIAPFREEMDTRENEIREALDVAMEILREKDNETVESVKYADNGYLKDGKKRLPLDSEKNVRTSWARINLESDSSAYTPAQLSRVKSKIKSAAKKMGVDVKEDFDNFVSEMRDLLEASASMSIYNGAGDISVSGYTDDAGKLQAVAMRVAASALVALNSLDPDADGDIDLAGGDSSDSDMDEAAQNGPDVSNNDDQVCGLCNAPLQDGFMYCPTCGVPVPTAESDDSANNTIKEGATMASENENTEVVAEAVAPVEAATPIETLVAEAVAKALAEREAKLAEAAKSAENDAIVAEAVAKALAAEEAKSAPVAVVAEAAPMDIAKMVAEAAAQAVEAYKETAKNEYRTGAPTRKGVVSSNYSSKSFELGEDEELDPAQLAEMDSSGFRRLQGVAWGNHPFFAHKFAAASRGY